MDPNKLKAILSGARAVMNAVDSGQYQKGNIDPTLLNGTITENTVVNGVDVDPYGNSTPAPQKQVPYRNIHTTKMPKEIVQAMLENPIQVPDSPYHTFELTEDFLHEINPNTGKKPTQQKNTNPAQRLAETKRTSLAGLTESQIRKIVREEMESIIDEYFDKRVIKEDIQIKVGSTIFSGKLSPLPSKKVTRKS